MRKSSFNFSFLGTKVITDAANMHPMLQMKVFYQYNNSQSRKLLFSGVAREERGGGCLSTSPQHHLSHYHKLRLSHALKNQCALRKIVPSNLRLESLVQVIIERDIADKIELKTLVDVFRLASNRKLLLRMGTLPGPPREMIGRATYLET